MIKAEEEACKEYAEKLKAEGKGNGPLDSLLFGVGLPLEEYWKSGSFNTCRFEGWSSNFLFWFRLIFIIICLGLTIPTWYTCSGEWLIWAWLWSFWSWFGAIIAMILSMLAARNPEYWHVTAYAWLNFSHGLNIMVTFCVWVVLLPYHFTSTEANQGYFKLMGTQNAYKNFATA